MLKDGTPAGIVSSWDRVEPAGAEVWWKLYESWGAYDRPKWMHLNYPIDGMLDEEHPQEAARMPAVQPFYFAFVLSAVLLIASLDLS